MSNRSIWGQNRGQNKLEDKQMYSLLKFYAPRLINDWVMDILNIWPPRLRSKRGQGTKSRSDLVRGHIDVLPFKNSVL